MPRRRGSAQAVVLLTARFKRSLWYGENVTQRALRESTQINDSVKLSITCYVGRFELIRDLMTSTFTGHAGTGLRAELGLNSRSAMQSLSAAMAAACLITAVGRCQWTRRESVDRSVTTVRMIIFAERVISERRYFTCPQVLV